VRGIAHLVGQAYTPGNAPEVIEKDPDVTIRRIQLLLTAVGMVTLGATEMYTLSVAKTSISTQMDVKNSRLSPASLTVKAGSIVTWTNKDDEPHTVVSGRNGRGSVRLTRTACTGSASLRRYRR
jgi:plastocyanin